MVKPLLIALFAASTIHFAYSSYRLKRDNEEIAVQYIDLAQNYAELQDLARSMYRRRPPPVCNRMFGA